MKPVATRQPEASNEREGQDEELLAQSDHEDGDEHGEPPV